jgi:SAM-dependent methyltransferase
LEFEEVKIMYEAEDTHWWYRGLRGVMFELLRLHRPGAQQLRILDAGCGTGGTLAAFTRAGFKQLDGFDLNATALDFCRERGLDYVKLGSLTDIPFESDAFDVIVSNDVLNDAGISNEADALRELYRALKPGGRLFLNLPAYRFLASEHDRATDVVRRYTRKEIAGKLSASGFRVARVTYWNMLLFPVVLLVRLLRRERTHDLAKPARSDILVPPAPFNALLTAMLWVERGMIRFADLPAGSSVAVVAVKPGVKGRQAKP